MRITVFSQLEKGRPVVSGKSECLTRGECNAADGDHDENDDDN